MSQQQENGANGAVVAIENVSYSYGPTPALNDVNIDVYHGDFACIVGPNGGGKTTLAKIILGLLQPDTGRVTVLGTTPSAARARIGYMPQYFHFDPSFPIKVLDVVLMGRLHRHRNWGRYDKSDYEAAERALKEVGLAALPDRPFASLSGGQRQRVLLARALSAAPELLILDEPMANIDPAGQVELQELLRQLHERLTILMVTHDMGFVLSLVNRVICVNRTVWHHPTSEITGDTIINLYGNGVTLVRHDHRCITAPPGAEREE